LQLAEHLQAHHHKWLRNVNEKSSLSQAIIKVKALEHKYHSSERSAAAPPVLHQQIPITPYELSGQVAHSSSNVVSEYHPITFGELENPPSSSSRNIVHHNSPFLAILDTSHISDAGPLKPAHAFLQKKQTR